MAFVEYSLEGHVASIRLNRPERLNAVGRELRAALTEAWRQFLADDEARVVILSGEGRVFCAGRDIKEQASGRFGSGGWISSRLQGKRPEVTGFYGVPETEKPIVTAVQGGAWGLGFFMVCGSDVCVTSEDAQFAMSEVPTGIIGPAFFPLMNTVPWLPGSEIALRGHTFTAQRAYELGLVNHVVPADAVLTTARAIAEELAALPPVHVQATKQQLLMARPRPNVYQLDIAFPKAFAYLMTLKDTSEAARAFAERRRPNFQGR